MEDSGFQWRQNGATKFLHFLHDLFGAFFDDKALAAGEGDHRIWSGFDVLNEVGIEDQWHVVEPGQVYHGNSPPSWDLPIYRSCHAKTLQMHND